MKVDKADSPLMFLAQMVQEFRTYLWGQGFVELPTALIHEHDACPIFQRVRLDDGRFLKESGGLALRCQLAHAPKVFEIAQCARRDPLDWQHLQQFQMLDLYVAGATLEDAIALCMYLVTSVYDGPTGTCSVADHMLATVGVDLTRDPDCERKLRGVLAQRYCNAEASLFSLVNEYMTKEIEPLSRGRLLVVSDIPRAAESSGRQAPNTFGVARIAEVQIDGMEVVQLIEDESDPDAYLQRARTHGHYGPEVEVVVSHIREGVIPSSSAGFGIGLERLAMAATGRRDVRAFMPSSEFIKEF